jgi:hypothetical protein
MIHWGVSIIFPRSRYLIWQTNEGSEKGIFLRRRDAGISAIGWTAWSWTKRGIRSDREASEEQRSGFELPRAQPWQPSLMVWRVSCTVSYPKEGSSRAHLCTGQRISPWICATAISGRNLESTFNATAATDCGDFGVGLARSRSD